MSSRVTAPQVDIDNVVTCFRNAVRRARTEEDVRVWVSRCIEDGILEPLDIKEVGRYEYTLVSGARVDALYGHVIIEYKAPGKLSEASDIQRAKEQVVRYVTQEAGSKVEWSRYLGVIISDKIAFVRYDPRTGTWILRGPYEIRRETVVKLVEALRGLRRKSLDVKHLLNDFGPKSQLTVKLVKSLYSRVVNLKEGRARLLFSDWARLFRQATGYKPEELEELPKLAREYGIEGTVNYDALIFSMHTYYALLLKLLAAEIVYLWSGGRLYRSYIAELDDAYSRKGVEGLREALQELESGGVFKKLASIENFLEGDYFSWYLDILDAELADMVAELARMLADYEVATPQLEPEFARDLLKRLYQNLVPGDLRHRLGEYYTPDWLADYLLNEVGLSLENLLKMGEENTLKPLEIRVLDPACGSGTFLVLYISRLRRYAEEHFLQDTLVSYVLKNVVGYDLNPLAVLTARTNYLLAVADLLPYARGSVEIPVYLADSIMVERRTSLVGNVYVLRTSAGEFEVQVGVVERGFLPGVLVEVARCLEGRYSVEDFRKRLEVAFKLNPGEIDALSRLYATLLKLEEEGRNRVWVAVIRNAFAPILKGKFDYVVGNPPWVNWENLPEEYREISRPLWDHYGMSKVVSTGAFKKDLAMLFLVRCFDLYLKPGGKLGFLVPFTLFKTQAGAGFRAFLARRAKIHVVHDLVTLYPFEGVTNRTSAVVVEKICELNVDIMPNYERERCIKITPKIIEENTKGIRHIIWVNPTGRAIPTDAPLDEVFKETKRYEAVMLPVDPKEPGSAWMQITPRAVEAVRKLLRGTQYYEAYAGVLTALNQVYYVQVKGKTPDGKLIITNPPEPGTKKIVKQVDATVEPDLVYPLLRGKDVKKWYIDFKERYIVLPHYEDGKPIPHSTMRIKYPLTWQYLYLFFDDLINRSGGFLKQKLAPYKKHPIERAEKLTVPFYYVMNNVKASLVPYKVVWKRIAGAITGKAVSFACAVVEPIGGKPTVPDDSTILVETKTPEEAYYIAGLLNSTIIRAIIASYTYELRQETHIVDVIKIPRFDPNNELHKKITGLSMKAHELAKCIYAKAKPDYCRGIDTEEELRSVERELDLAVAQLFGLSEEDFREFERLLAILSGEELPVEEEVEIPEEPKVSVLNTLLPPDTRSYIEVDVVNPSGEEVEFYYEFPWGRGSFKVVEGKYRVETPQLKPGKYGGVVRYRWRGVEKVIEVVVEVSEVSGPRRRRGLLPGSG